MQNSERAWLCGLVVTLAASARAQQPAQGFNVERLYAAPAGAGWFVMDDLNLSGGLGGSIGLTIDHSKNPLHVGALSVVSDSTLADIGASATYGRFRVHLDFETPIALSGQSGSVGAYSYSAPAVDLSTVPDGLSDVGLGAEVRLLGDPRGPIRIGASGELFFPGGTRDHYDSDGTFRGMLRLLFAGGGGAFLYAGHIGVHVRPLDDSPVPGSPRGSELLFGVAAGSKVPLDAGGAWCLVVGPELFGATALNAAFSSSATAVEGLLAARIEGTRTDALQLRFKLGIGSGINRQFGTPDWRVVAGIELFNRSQRSEPGRAP